MMTILNWMTMIWIFVCLSLMGACVANLSNVFKKEKEDNIIFNAISWLPRWVLARLRIRATYFRVAMSSFILNFAIVSIYVFAGFTFFH